MGDPRRPFQRKELRKLNDIGQEAQAEFRAAWQQIDPERRREIATAMAELSEENVEFDFRDIFTILLDDSEAEVREAAIDGLWEDERLPTLRQILPLLASDPDPGVRASAALALGRYAYRASCDDLSARVGRDVREALARAVTDYDQPDDVRRRALEGLAYFGGDDVLDAIGQAYTSGKQPMKESALAAMGHTLDERWLPVFEVELQSSEAAMRYEAARAAGEFGSSAERLLPRLLPLAEGDDSEVAQAAIWALGQIGGEGARRTLKRLGDSDDPAIAQAADEALTELQLGEDSLGLV
jgi:HEAT repeat protein